MLIASDCYMNAHLILNGASAPYVPKFLLDLNSKVRLVLFLRNLGKFYPGLGLRTLCGTPPNGKYSLKIYPDRATF